MGPLAVIDISQTQLWRDHGPQEVVVEVTEQRRTLPTEDRAALRLAAGTSVRAVGRTINKLLAGRPVVTGTEVFDATPAERLDRRLARVTIGTRRPNGPARRGRAGPGRARGARP